MRKPRLIFPLLLLAGLAASYISPAHARRSGPTGRYAVIIVLDGAPPGILDLSRMPNLRGLIRSGTTYTDAFVGQEIANTPPSHATIGTGVFPRRHGIMGFWWEDGRTRTMTRPTDPGPVDAGALEQIMASRHVPSIAAAVKKAYPGAKIVSSSGHKCYAADAMGTAAADYILCAKIYHDRWVAQAVGRHQPPPGAVNNPKWDVPIPPPTSAFAPAVEQWRLGWENAWTINYSLWAFKRVHYPRVMMINLPETDVLGHFAPNPKPVMDVLMTGFDQKLGAIIRAYRQAHILKRTDFVITADHGMSRVQRRMPFSVLDDAIQQAGATKVFLEADTAAVIGIRQADKARAVARRVAALGGDYIDATYYKTRARGAWTYRPAFVRSSVGPGLARAYLTLANTSADIDGPDVLAVYAPHVTTGDRPARGYHWVGGHLGPQWGDQHIPLIISGAGVRRGFHSSYPARLVDIAPTVEHLLGAPDGGSDGVVLADALAKPNHRSAVAQQQRARALQPIVRALKARWQQ